MSDVHVIHLWPRESECCICKCDLVTVPGDTSYGIPMYEDFVLPNDWEGDWGGFDACLPCFTEQEKLTAPLPQWEFLKIVQPPTRISER